MRRKLSLLGVILGVAGLAIVVSAKTPDGQTPPQEDVCAGLSGAAYGLCTSYCEAQDCDVQDRPSCDVLRANFAKLTGSTQFPCDAPAPVCGDGIVQDGEQCDDGNNVACDGCSPNCGEETCGDGVVCFPEECEPGNVCEDDGTVCNDDCICAFVEECPCGDFCVIPDGFEGVCRDPDGDEICECVPNPPECPCGATCITPDGEAGTCSDPDANGICECVANPPECPCGTTCTTSGGVVGACRDPDGNGICECVANPPECPCGATCITPDGEAGSCRDCDRNEICECTATPTPTTVDECVKDAVCGALQACTTGDGCTGACFFTAAGNTRCFAGELFCAGLSPCLSDSDCCPGFACSNSCCGLRCAPLCGSTLGPAAAPGDVKHGGTSSND